MSKLLKVMVALLAIAAIAAPAMAEVKINGYYRIQGTLQSPTAPTDVTAPDGKFENFNYTDNEDLDDSSFIDQRMRLKVTNSLNDRVSVVWYGEYDMPWGGKSSNTVSGGGGELSADGIGLETKNAYVDFMINSDWSVRAGIQGAGLGGNYNGFVVWDDMNGVNFNGKLGALDLTAGYFKWKENDFAEDDDLDYYSLDGSFDVNENFMIGLTADLMKNDSTTAVNGTAAETDDYYFGTYAQYTMHNLGFSGNFLFRNSSGDGPVDTDGDTWMLNLTAKMGLPTGNVKAHFIYMPADDSDNGADRFSANNTEFELYNNNLQIFGSDIYYNNGSQGAINVYSAAYAGYGLMGLAVSGDYKLPEDAYFKYGLGYYMAADDSPDSTTAKDDSDLGTEVAAQIGKKFATYYDLSLRGSYAFMGDFYGDNVDDLYKVVTMLNVSF